MLNAIRSTAVVLCAALAFATACSTEPGAGRQAESAGDGAWPCTVEHEAGTTRIDQAPTRIVSTSPSLTGSLLAIGAPVIATAAAPKTALTDDRGFFSQWAGVVEERGVQVLYPNLELDVDAIDELEPDLIIGSVNGADTVAEAYDQLSEIAPTVLLDYGTQSWQNLTEELGRSTGREQAATDLLAGYESWVAERRADVAPPPQPVAALVYLGPDGAWVFAPDSPQAELLSSLGFEYARLPERFVAEKQAGANGVQIVSSENLAGALSQTKTLFVDAPGGRGAVEDFRKDRLVANVPAVTAARVYSLGPESFRLDYDSARNTVDSIVETFGR